MSKKNQNNSSLFQSDNNHSNYDSFNDDKYEEMLPKSQFKTVKNNLFSLYLFVLDEAPDLSLFHSIFSVFRLIQLFAPSLMFSSLTLYNFNSPIHNLINLFSPILYISPITRREQFTTGISYFYSSFMICFFILFICSSFYFKAYSKLPKWISLILILIISIFCYYLHTAALATSGEILAKILNNQNNFSLISRKI
jgi:hypothetical protein